MSEQEYDLLPEGYYEAVAVKTDADDGSSAYARLMLTKSDGKQAGAHFKILNPPEGFSLGFPLPWYGAFSSTIIGKGSKARTVAQMTVESLRAMGFKGNELADVESQDLNQIVSVKVEHNEWEGVTRARVSFVNTPGGGSIKINNPMGRDALRQFSAMMRDSLSKVPEVKGDKHEGNQSQQSSPPAQSQGFGGGSQTNDSDPPPFEDDIPFATVAELYLGRRHQPGGCAV